MSSNLLYRQLKCIQKLYGTPCIVILFSNFNDINSTNLNNFIIAFDFNNGEKISQVCFNDGMENAIQNLAVKWPFVVVVAQVKEVFFYQGNHDIKIFDMENESLLRHLESSGFFSIGYTRQCVDDLSLQK